MITNYYHNGTHKLLAQIEYDCFGGIVGAMYGGYLVPRESLQDNDWVQNTLMWNLNRPNSCYSRPQAQPTKGVFG